MALHYRSIPADRKQEMVGVIDRWAKTGTSIDVLTEGINILAKPGRVAHFQQLIDSRDAKSRALIAIAFTHARNYGAKGVLSQEDAQKLLELVAEVRSKVPEPPSSTNTTMVRVAHAFFKDELPPTPHDLSWAPTVSILTILDPGILQKPLF